MRERRHFVLMMFGCRGTIRLCAVKMLMQMINGFWGAWCKREWPLSLDIRIHAIANANAQIHKCSSSHHDQLIMLIFPFVKTRKSSFSASSDRSDESGSTGNRYASAYIRFPFSIIDTILALFLHSATFLIFSGKQAQNQWRTSAQ